MLKRTQVCTLQLSPNYFNRKGRKDYAKDAKNLFLEVPLAQRVKAVGWKPHLQQGTSKNQSLHFDWCRNAPNLYFAVKKRRIWPQRTTWCCL